jgi:hypothetical protein
VSAFLTKFHNLGTQLSQLFQIALAGLLCGLFQRLPFDVCASKHALRFNQRKLRLSVLPFGLKLEQLRRLELPSLLFERNAHVPNRILGSCQGGFQGGRRVSQGAGDVHLLLKMLHLLLQFPSQDGLGSHGGDQLSRASHQQSLETRRRPCGTPISVFSVVVGVQVIQNSSYKIVR